MNVSWRIHETATVLHVAAAIARGLPLADRRLADAVETPVAAIQREIRRAEMPDEDAWSALCEYACLHADADEVVRSAMPLTGQRRASAAQERISCLVSQVADGIRGILPELGDDLRLRSRPLREQWDARGPGLLHGLRRFTGHGPGLEQASVFPVHPILGGGGAVDPSHAAVRIEALLANTVPGLPEVVRLGWLLGQLACQGGLHVTSQHPPGPRCRTIELAMVPATLAAAETVELAVCNAQTVGNAIAAWLPGPSGEQTTSVEATAQQVWKWWESRHEDASWGQSLDKLGQRLPG